MDEAAPTEVGKPFMSFELESRKGAGHLDVILDSENSIAFYPSKVEFFTPALHTVSRWTRSEILVNIFGSNFYSTSLTLTYSCCWTDIWYKYAVPIGGADRA